MKMQEKKDSLIGPFFVKGNKIIARPISWSQGERRLDKYDSSLGHAELYDQTFRYGEYMDIPRGRVIWDASREESIIYLDRCIAARPDMVAELISLFQADAYRLEYDEHYVCPGCGGNIFF